MIETQIQKLVRRLRNNAQLIKNSNMNERVSLNLTEIANEIEQLYLPVVVRGGVSENVTLRDNGSITNTKNVIHTTNTPTEPLATEARDAVAVRGG